MMKRITDPTFRYVPASKTDVAATFRRVRREQQTAEQRKAENVRPLKVKGKA